MLAGCLGIELDEKRLEGLEPTRGNAAGLSLQAWLYHLLCGWWWEVGD